MSKLRRQNSEEERADETWLIPYADLLTLLLALFIVLFSSSSLDAEKLQQMSDAFSIALSSGSGVLENTSVIRIGDDLVKKRELGSKTERQQAEMIRKEQQDLEQLKRKLDQYIQDHGLTAQLSTLLNHSELKITIRDHALFDSGSATVKPDARELAVAIAGMLEQHPSYEIVVSGHTDNVPIHNREFQSNWDLSSKRSLNFMRYLLDNPTLEPGHFSAVGYGEYRPIIDNKTEQNRAINRRVEVSILRKFIQQSDGTFIRVEPAA